ncbi:hypothetical protein RA26_11745 [Leisingera sp. ANG-M7]|nr:hypothetical protein RA26_11745 [Leisingera sp. ANG-M7]
MKNWQTSGTGLDIAEKEAAEAEDLELDQGAPATEAEELASDINVLPYGLAFISLLCSGFAPLPTVGDTPTDRLGSLLALTNDIAAPDQPLDMGP